MKEGVVKYVKIVKRLFIAVSVVAIPALMVSLVLAFSHRVLCYYLAPAIAVAYFVLYGYYALRVSLGTALSVETTDKVVHIKTKRKTFTYDLDGGCVSLKTYKNKFVGVFESQTSREKFVFYRRVLFSKYSEEQFTEEDLRPFLPAETGPSA